MIDPLAVACISAFLGFILGFGLRRLLARNGVSDERIAEHLRHWPRNERRQTTKRHEPVFYPEEL